jgi:hypothetical protein
MNTIDIVFCMIVIGFIAIVILYYSFFHDIVKQYLLKQQSTENTKQVKNIMKSLDESSNLVKL